MSRGAGARVSGVVFALALPQVLFLAPDFGRSDAILQEGGKHTEAFREVSRELLRLAEENIQDQEESEESLRRRQGRAAEMTRLTERAEAQQQEHAAQFARLEAGATRSWQWKILAICFGLGMLIARYTGTEAPRHEPQAEPVVNA